MSGTQVILSDDTTSNMLTRLLDEIKVWENSQAQHMVTMCTSYFDKASTENAS